jgi:hypothetical protein
LLAAPVLVAYQKPGQFSIGLLVTGLICLFIITGSIIVSKRGGFKRIPFEV